MDGAPPYTMKKTMICLQCKREYTKNLKPSDWKIRKYCSMACVYEAMKQKPDWMNTTGLERGRGWNKGKSGEEYLSEDSRKRMADNAKRNLSKESELQRRTRTDRAVATKKSRDVYNPNQPKGKNTWMWKGQEAGYHNIHKWVNRTWKRTGTCEHCGEQKVTNWANKDHLYSRESKSEWMELCARCHLDYDREHGLRK